MSNLQLASEGLSLIKQLNDKQTTLVSATAACQRLHRGPQLAAYLVASRQPFDEADYTTLVELVQKMRDYFDDTELDDLCFQLGIDHEELGSKNKGEKARDLVTYVQRRGRLSELITLVVQLRPKVAWGKWKEIAEVAIMARPNLAIVVNLASRYPVSLLTDVATYLDANGNLDANFLLFENPNENKNIEFDNQWDLFPKLFNRSINVAQNVTRSKYAHFFLSGPGPILFSLGCIWGTVKDATVYHHNGNSYQPVIAISKKLLS
ncbi:MAG: SAVED domain-containing protein [Chloroflexi bacterium]|nr:SAVED domain-containing protein [Chloroflexota bacterium]MCI0580856.1 SAVED domain-containing protein [Chloroflexota bacterium]